MSTADIKRHLHSLIETVDNRAVLQAVETLLTQQIPPASPALSEAIEEALQQSAAGQGRSHTEVMAEMFARFGAKA